MNETLTFWIASNFCKKIEWHFGFVLFTLTKRCIVPLATCWNHVPSNTPPPFQHHCIYCCTCRSYAIEPTVKMTALTRVTETHVIDGFS